MKNLRQAIMLGAATSLLMAPLAFAQATDAEFKCEGKASAASSKFVGAKAKCVGKCLQNYWKGLVPESDCLPPYGGATASACIKDTVLGLKGAEDKFSFAIRKACDPATSASADCPECYSSGDCSAAGYAGDQVQNIEGQVDSFVPGVACERAGATPAEQKCQQNTAKVLAKQVGSVVKCYDKCKSNERKGLISAGTCNPPASDPATQTCVSKSDGKSIAGINKLCGDVGGSPDNCGSPYPDGASWVNLVGIAISGNIPGTYCE